MSTNKFEKVTAQILASDDKKNHTAKKPTKKQIELALKREAERKALEALAAEKAQEEAAAVEEVKVEEVVATPEPEDPIAAAFAAMEAHPDWEKALKIADLYKRAGDAETEIGIQAKEVERLTKEISLLEKRLEPVQKDYSEKRAGIEQDVMGDPRITFKPEFRQQLKGGFHKIVEAGVQAAIKKTPAVFELQSQLAALTAEAEALRQAKQHAAEAGIKARAQANEYLKEAHALEA